MSETKPRIGLVLGSGGARGLAHIIAFETFDRLGIRPVEIAGASIGAILGAAYASAFPARPFASMPCANSETAPR